MQYDPRAKLSEHKEGWLSLGIHHGEPLSSRAASELLRGVYTGYDPGELKWEVAHWMIRSAMARHDRETVRMYVNDWSKWTRKRSAVVSKFIPGDHYHVLGTKFDTLDEAKNHLFNRGYAFGGLIETYVPKTQE